MFRKFFLTICLIAAASAAQAQAPQGSSNDGPEASRAPKVAAPSGKLNFQTDLFTGRFGYSVPIQAAPARNGSEPDIALRYNSASENGWCGNGWDLEMGFIQRETKRGVPVKWGAVYPLREYDNAKGFVFSLGGQSAALVNVASNEYRAEIEAGFLKFTLVTNVGAMTTNYWQVIDKGGNKYFFGLTANSRMVNSKTGWPSNTASGTFRWALSRIETVTGDTTALTYTNLTGAQYPLVLAYNGHSSGLTNSHTVEFQLGDRTDKRIAYNSGYRVETSKRLTNILAKVSGRLVRRYLLSYTNSPSTTRSLIRSVTMFGTNSTDSLPPLSFNYSVQPFQFEAQTTWTNVTMHNSDVGFGFPFETDDFGLYADLVDMNGDGLPDRLTSYPYGGPWPSLLVQANTGRGFGSYVPWAITSQGLTGNIYWSEINSSVTRLIDINGDAFPDRVMDNYWAYVNQPNARYTNFWVEYNQGAGFSGDTAWTNIIPFNMAIAGLPGVFAIENPGSVKMIDMNGDGLPDRLMTTWQLSGAAPFTNYLVQFNTGNGFAGTNYFGPFYSQGQWTNQGSALTTLDLEPIRLIDINGDSLPDRVMMPMNPVTWGSYTGLEFTNFVVEFNNGYGFEPEQKWLGIDPQYYAPQGCNGAPSGAYGYVQDQPHVVLNDINGDGLPDRIMRAYCPPHTNWLVQINTGNGFAPVKNFGPAFSQGATDDANTVITSPNGAIAFLDINGDSLPDRVMRKLDGIASDNYFVVELNKGPFPDLLTVVSNGIGGRVNATYKPSTEYDNRESTGSSTSPRLLPFPLYTVSSVSESDGLYPSNKTTYAYEGGMWSAARREFHGFARVQVTDPLGLSTIQWFHQSGGRDYSTVGEYGDTTTAIAKKGISYRTETIGTNGQLYKLSLSKVEDANLGSGRHFAFVSQSVEIDYVGTNSGSRATAQGFGYDLATGNLLATTNYGEVTVTSIPAQTITDTGADIFYQFTAYAALANTNVLNRPESITVAADAAGSVILRESLFDYDGTTGSLTRQRDRICEGSYRATGFGYDSYGNLTDATNAADIVTQTVYDSAYRVFPVQQTTAGSYVSSAIYDSFSGSLLSSTDSKGLVTSNALDSLRRLTNTSISTTPNGAASLWVARYSYGLGGIVSGASKNFVRVRKNDDTDTTNGHETWTYSDGLGRAIQVRIEAETNGYRVADSVYDQRGALRLETQPYFSGGTSTATNHVPPTGTKSATHYEHDPIARPVKLTPAVDASFSGAGLLQSVSVPAGDALSPAGTTLTAYNDGTNPWAIVRTDEESKVRKFLLDAFGRTNQIVEVTGAGNYTTTLSHDKTGTLTNITDHAGNNIEFSHNDLGELIAMADPDMGVWEYRRDVAGRIREQVDAKTNVLVFDYTDPLGRLKTRLAYNPQGAFVRGVTNVYDSSDDGAFTIHSGQLYKVSDSEGFEKHSLDFRGRTLKTARFLAKNGQTYTTQHNYDGADRIRSTVYPNSGPTVTNIYDVGGNLITVKRVDGTNSLVYYQARGFNSQGQLLGVNFGNAVTTTNDYWPSTKRLKQVVTFKTGGTNIQNISYAYDRASNLKSISDGVYSGSESAALTNLVYDDLHRLTSLTRPATSATTTYSYSPIGNIAANGEIGVDTYNYGVRMPHAVKTVGSIRSYGYDANGNMISRYGQKLEYDPENHLSRLSTFTQTNTFGYNGDGARLWKQGTNTLQVWIGSLYEEKQGRVLFHIEAEGRPVCTFDATTTNVFEYYHGDHLRSTAVLTDKAGNRIQHHEYSAFGRDRFTVSLTAFPVSRRHTSQVLDEDTGLYFYGARYYDPEIGRFIQADTIIPDFSNPQSYNRYAYALNNPLKYVDKTGHAADLGDGVTVLPTGYVVGGAFSIQAKFGQDVNPNVRRFNVAEQAAVNLEIAVQKGDTVRAQAYANQLRPYLEHGVDLGAIQASAENPAGTANYMLGIAAGMATHGAVGPMPKTSAFNPGFRPQNVGVPELTPMKKGGIAPVLKGQEGVARSEAAALARGETIRGKEVTFELPGGGRTRADLLTESRGKLKIVESKNGPNAQMTTRQNEAQSAVQQGQNLIPRGANAEKAGLAPGQSVQINQYQVDKH